MRLARVLFACAAISLMATSLPSSATAIPAFARKYGVSCNLCHAPVPKLTAFGEEFAANGFELQPGEPARDTIDTGDGLLRLLRRIEFAVRLDLFATARTPIREEEPSIDLQMPYNIKLLSGGVLADKISYYMYFFLSERGEVAGLEDAYIQFTDIGGSGVSLMAGQFQVSDPLFKRELRLEYEDYQAYRVRVGDARSDMTYDRGLFASASPWTGSDVALIVVNGTGLSAADEDRQYDSDALKNVAVRLSQEVGPIRVGGFAYFGEQQLDAADDRIRVFGPDITIGLGNIELNGQYLRRTDSNPFFDGLQTDTEVDAAFAEVVWSPGGGPGRWHFTGLYNWIDSDAPVFTLRAGEEEALSHYESLNGSMHYLVRRNVRFLGEVGYDLERERTRFTIGGVLAW
ncbi:MAG TPA: hypothetical protein VGD27_19230 [Longimicrobiales bacterium]